MLPPLLNCVLPQALRLGEDEDLEEAADDDDDGQYSQLHPELAKLMKTEEQEQGGGKKPRRKQTKDAGKDAATVVTTGKSTKMALLLDKAIEGLGHKKKTADDKAAVKAALNTAAEAQNALKKAVTKSDIKKAIIQAAVAIKKAKAL
jgi:hypothetical protein